MPSVLRIATYNIHKGVQGLGPARRLEIHNLRDAVSQFDADIVCLQEVRKMHRLEEAHFSEWPLEPQADFLAPHGFEAVYRTNAVTRHGEHGNALLTRWPVVRHQHQDMSDHRFEQRGLLHVELAVRQRVVHVIVAHFGLIPSSRRRQAAHICDFVRSEIPVDEPVIVAGDFNDWGLQVRHVFAQSGLLSPDRSAHSLTYPSILPVAQLDYVYARGLVPLKVEVPRGKAWHRMSDHLPLVAELAWPIDASMGAKGATLTPGVQTTGGRNVSAQ